MQTESSETTDSSAQAELPEAADSADPSAQAEQEQIAESSDSSETPSAQKAEVKYRGIADQDKGKRLFIRKSPSTEGEVLGVLWTGQSGEIIDIGDEWVLLKYGDIEGYVFKEFLIIEELPQSADPQGL
ncbi:MAG: SH3 domain-containing protein [Lachnospiraceae bacterium]|nr:SH3 domain-containing protein [Lachnospiraceae bacterium]